MNKPYKYEEVKEHFTDWMNEQDREWLQNNKDEWHHECFNTDYYIIGTQDAIEWMGNQAFGIIQFVKEYEEDNFGQCSTPLDDPERVVNMYVYIIGEEVVNDYRAKKDAA